jgi:hypothetical protein
MRLTFFFRIRQLSHLLLVGTPTIAHSDIGWTFDSIFLTPSIHLGKQSREVGSSQPYLEIWTPDEL